MREVAIGKSECNDSSRTLGEALFDWLACFFPQSSARCWNVVFLSTKGYAPETKETSDSG